MAIETIAALAAKKAVAEIAPVVITAVATTVAKEILERPDEIIEDVVCAPLNVVAGILDRLDRML